MVTPTTRKRMKKEERIAHILEAARKVFINKGYSGATTIEIAQQAEISEVTLFRYFSSKQEIFLQAVEPVLTQSLEEAILSTNGLSSKEKLIAILKERIHFISENRPLVKLVLMESQLNNDLITVNIIGKITARIKQALNEMEMPEVKKKFILRLFMGIALSFLFLEEEKNEETTDFAEQIVNLISIK